MTCRRIRVSSSALGHRLTVPVQVYDDVADLRAAAERFNSQAHEDTLGVTHAYVDGCGRVTGVLVRLARGHLGTEVLAHELHHATAALYGATLPAQITVSEHLNHHNERFAHLFSDLAGRLVCRLYELGYYDDGGGQA